MSPTYIGSIQLTKDAKDDNCISMPDNELSFNSVTSYMPNYKPNEIYLVLQHSNSAGSSAMLHCSNIVGTFTTQKDARKYLHELKAKRRPLVKRQIEEVAGARAPLFWCAGDPDDEEECGFTFTGDGEEEFTVWIEDHAVNQ